MLKFVKGALNNPPLNAPWRGPKLFTAKDMPKWRYENSWKGGIKEFNGLEKIFQNKKQVGWTVYQGGLVNRKHTNI